MKNGVLDSGIGGEAVAQALQRRFPDATITSVNDKENVPYGDKSHEEIRALTDAAIELLLGNDVIVIACNSATASAIEWLRERYPTQLFIGLEPMIKPAAVATKSNVIAVCATPATLTSERYRTLKDTYAQDVTVLEPDCSTWAKMIEDNTVNERQIADQITQLIDQKADVIVLGCTHYHWIKDDILKLTQDRAAVIDPSDAIADRVADLLT
jgi:glutamate racemase